MMSLACVCLNFVFGIFNACFPKALVIKSVHSIFGILTIIFAFLSLILALDVGIVYGIIVMTVAVISLIGVVTSAVITTMRRICC